MAVRIRLKKFGRKHRPFFRLCVMDVRAPRDGRVLEELGYYDPLVPETDARAILNGERIDYWIGVGALPSSKAGILIKKYGSHGTHLEEQKVALEKVASMRRHATAPAPTGYVTAPVKEEAAPAAPTAPAEQPAAE